MDDESPQLEGFASDDRVGLDAPELADASVLAEVLIARSMAPPLSVGILGKPGSGTSFTASLVAHRVEHLAREAGAQPVAQRAYMHPVAQIEIDAWHSASESPWLVIAENVYSRLDESLAESGNESWAPALLHLPSVARLHALATTELHAAEAAFREAEGEREEISAAYFAASERRARLESASTWPRVNEQFAERLDVEKFAALDRAGERLGLTALASRPDVLAGIHDAMRTVGGTASLLTDTRVVRRYLGSALLLVVALALGALAVAFGYVVLTSISKLKDQVTAFFAAVAGISSLIAAFGVLLAGLRQNQAARALQTVRSHESMLSSVVRDVGSDHRRSIFEATAEHERLSGLFAESESRLSSARRSVTIAESRRADLVSRTTLSAVARAYRAPEQRAETLPLLIRSDLEALSRLLSSRSALGMPERLVIYVDGLNQCGPSATVGFLLAIQQLLAFQLFAVVLTGDPDHFARSLEAMEILSSPATREGRLSDEAADYLAKLLQLHLRVAAPTYEQVSRLTSEIFSPFTPAEIEFVTHMAPAVRAPRDAKRLVNTLRLAKALVGGPQPLPLALQAHVAVIALAPASARLYADILARDSIQSLDDLQHALAHAGIEDDAVEQILATYASLASSSDAMEALRRWIPMVRRLAL